MARHRKKGRSLHGILLLDKPFGVSSNHALQQAKHLFRAQKAGHTGTLDPLATGMLPICFGEATKFASFLLDTDKRYSTTATLGITTTTGDAEGRILQQQQPPVLTEGQIESVLDTFRGQITQIPPMFSALKHQGKPLYELARKGIEVERKNRDVTIYRLVLTGHTRTTLELQVDCSKGTYIRTLVEDIGHTLGCGAHVSMLHRNHVSPFADQPSFSWKSLNSMTQAERDARLLPIDAGLRHFPEVTLDTQQREALFYGRYITIELPEKAALIRIYDEQHQFLGMGTAKDPQTLKPKRLIQQPA